MNKRKPTRMANRIWSYLKRSGLSQRQVARLLGYRSDSNLSRWVNGSKLPTLNNAIGLAVVLSTSVDALFPEHRHRWEDRINPRRGLDFHQKSYPDVIHKRSKEIATKGNQNRKSMPQLR